jgi:hypothetical protein
MQVKMDIANYTAALTTYSNAYNSRPCGDNATVTAKLLGDNPEKLAFLSLPPQFLNARGEFRDPKGLPYDIEVTTNTIRIKSLSK